VAGAAREIQGDAGRSRNVPPLSERAIVAGVPLLVLMLSAAWLGQRPAAPRFLRELPGILTRTRSGLVVVDGDFEVRARGRHTSLSQSARSSATSSRYFQVQVAIELASQVHSPRTKIDVPLNDSWS
jgi:hypothetical protein